MMASFETIMFIYSAKVRVIEISCEDGFNIEAWKVRCEVAGRQFLFDEEIFYTMDPTFDNAYREARDCAFAMTRLLCESGHNADIQIELDGMGILTEPTWKITRPESVV